MTIFLFIPQARTSPHVINNDKAVSLITYKLSVFFGIMKMWFLYLGINDDFLFFKCVFSWFLLAAEIGRGQCLNIK